jgi:prepilin-type processing-associated H-X9-DG protein
VPAHMLSAFDTEKLLNYLYIDGHLRTKKSELLIEALRRSSHAEIDVSTLRRYVSFCRFEL